MWVLEFHRGLADAVSEPGVDDRADRVGVLVMAREGCAEDKESKRDAVNDFCEAVPLAMGRLE